MTNLTRIECARFLREHDRFAIITHGGPDGDTIGSAAALCLGLRQAGKTAHVLENTQVAEKFQHLLMELTKPDAEEGDILIAVDVATARMISEESQHLAEKIDLRIDHHGTGVPFAALELVDSAAAACGEIIYDLLTLLDVEVAAPIGNALYTAVSSDTGCFRYANTTGNSFRLASVCADASGDIFRINQRLFDTVTLGRLRMQSWVVEHMQILQDGKIIICGIPADIHEKLDLADGDSGNLAGFLRSIEGVKMAATVRQDNEGHTGVSVRAVPGCDAAAVCQKLGGGGHKGAAGASLGDITMEEAVGKLIAALPDLSEME